MSVDHAADFFGLAAATRRCYPVIEEQSFLLKMVGRAEVLRWAKEQHADIYLVNFIERRSISSAYADDSVFLVVAVGWQPEAVALRSSIR